MLLEQIILERYVMFVTAPSERRSLARSVWEMIKTTYAEYGSGLFGTSLQDLINTPGVWKLVRRGNELLAGAIYKDTHGHKLRLVFHNNTPAGKDALRRLLHDDILDGYAWGEFSGRLEKVLRRFGAMPIPARKAEKILGKPIEKIDPDGYHYWREVYPGHLARQILLGNPDLMK